MSYPIIYSDGAKADLRGLDESMRRVIRKVIGRVAQNPLPRNEGGYGEPLGHKDGKNLTGLCKIKLLKLGIRVIYRVIRTEKSMEIIVIAARADGEAYAMAAQRIEDEQRKKGGHIHATEI